MTPLRLPLARRCGRLASALIAAMALLAIGPLCTLHAQNPDRPAPPDLSQVRTFFLKSATNLHQLNDIQTALRNMLGRTKIYGEASSNAIVVRGTPEEIDAAQKLIAELDRPEPIYRVTYTIAEIESGKRISSRTMAVVVPANGRGTLKRGKRVPLIAGTTGTGSDQSSQVQYIDVGMDLEVTAMGPQLRTKFAQTAVAEEKSGIGVPDPVIEQTTFEGASPLVTAKPVVLGTVDVPGTTQQQQISVRVELLSGN